MGGSGWRRRVLQGFFERRQQAWDRVYDLEEKAEAPPDFKRTTADLKRSIEVLKAGDPDGLRRLAEQSEQTRRQQEQTRRQQEQARAEAPRARRRVMLRFELPFAVLGLSFC